ncbi:hypothetical protein ACHQM5_005028 [Ranunculus cassubicifolius]
MSAPISLWGKPPSLLGNAAISKKQEEEPPKQRRRRRKQKRVSFLEMDSIAPGLVGSHKYQTRKSEYRFSEDATETESSNGSEIDMSKMNLEESAVQKDFVSEGETSDSDESDYYGDGHHCLDSVINRQLFELPCTHGLASPFKASVKTNVLKQLREVFDKEPTTELVLEIADSIDLLRIMGASNPMLDDIGRKAREGARLYAKGLKVMTEGQDLLRSCLSDVSSLK